MLDKWFVSPRWRSVSPKRSLQRSRGWLGSVGSCGPGLISPTFPPPGSPYTLQVPLQRKALLCYLEKSWEKERKRNRAAALSSHREALGSRSPFPCSGPSRDTQISGERQTWGLRIGGGGGTDESCGLFFFSDLELWGLADEKPQDISLARSLKTEIRLQGYHFNVNSTQSLLNSKVVCVVHSCVPHGQEHRLSGAAGHAREGMRWHFYSLLNCS